MDNKNASVPKNECWRGKAYSFYSNMNCEAFPCHSGVSEQTFNCLFCYCPLYALDDKCGGDFKYIKDGVKDCSACVLPHEKDNYGYVIERFGDIAAMMKALRNAANN